MNSEFSQTIERTEVKMNEVQPPLFFECKSDDIGQEQKELTNEEKIKLQNDEINAVKSGEKKLDTSLEKGNFGEMSTDKDMRDRGAERISTDMVTDLDQKTHQGIDGVYQKDDRYIIVDSKFGSAQLSETADGVKQMSDEWIADRLDDAVGKEKADEIKEAMIFEPDKVERYIAHVDENGNVKYDKLDGNANVIGKDVEI